MQWLLVGQGALASLLALRLQAQQDWPVTLLPRAGQALQPRHCLQPRPQQLQLQRASWPPQQPCVVVAAIKAYQVSALLRQLQPLPDNCQLILSYNGMLLNEAQLLPAQSMHWVTTHGAYLDGELLVHAGQGQSQLGYANSVSAGQPAPPWLRQLDQALPSWQWHANITLPRWQKLAINCLINPFTVLYQCPNGALQQYDLRAQQRQLAAEIVRLAASYDVPLQADALLQAAQHVIVTTAANRSSMLSDVLAGRPTELAYLNGFVAQQSAARGFAAPAHQQLWQQVDAKIAAITAASPQ